MITSQERKFVWEKWRDPLGSNLSETEWPGYEERDVPAENVELYDFSNSNTNVAEKEFPNGAHNFFEELGKKVFSVRPLKVVHTKLGLLTVVESTLAEYHFNFWILHSNYPFTPDDIKIIRDAPGVDAVTPLTRYRCKIGFNKSELFNIPECKMEVQRMLSGIRKDDSLSIVSPFSNEVQTQINTKISEMKQKGGQWAMWVLPNGSMEIFETDSITEAFKGKISVFEESQKLVGGKVFTSV